VTETRPSDPQSEQVRQAEQSSSNARPGGPQPQQPSGQSRPRDPSQKQNRQGGNGNRPFAPIAGEDFLDWSDRLRDVEEMIDDPELRAEAAQVRDRARGFSKDLTRPFKQPNWELVKTNVLEPLVALHRQVDQELLRRTADDTLVKSGQAMQRMESRPAPIGEKLCHRLQW
jgi:hypothetical protein